MSEPGLAIIGITDAVVLKPGRIGGTAGVDNTHSAGRIFCSAKTKIEPLVKIRCFIGTNLQLNIASILAVYYFNITRIKVLTYVHNIPL